MRPKKAEHCGGLDMCCLGWYGFFSCLHLHSITKYVVVKDDVGKKDQKRVFFKNWFLLWFLCFVFGCFLVLVFFF